MRAFFQSVPMASKDPTSLQAAAAAFLGGYASEWPLRAEDVETAYDVYLLQLAASTYGLSPLDDHGLRGFGRWRTRMAGYLSEHRGVLRRLLADLPYGPPAVRGGRSPAWLLTTIFAP